MFNKTVQKNFGTFYFLTFPSYLTLINVNSVNSDSQIERDGWGAQGCSCDFEGAERSEGDNHWHDPRPCCWRAMEDAPLE